MFKKSVVIGAHKFRKNRKSFTDYKVIIFFCLFICGVIFGVMLSQKGSESWHNFFSTLINNRLTAKLNSSLLLNFCGAFTPFFILFLYNYIFGICGVGIPFVYMSSVIFGIYSGICAAQFFSGFGSSGILYWCVVNIPCNAIVAATLIKCCCYSCELSNYIFSVLIYPKTERKDKVLKEYTLKYLFMMLPVAIASLLNTITFSFVGKSLDFIG